MPDVPPPDGDKKEKELVGAVIKGTVSKCILGNNY